MQAPEFTHLSTEVFDVLTVDESENCMCMYDFIKKKPEINEFTNGHAFYELTKEEDLRYYRDIVYLAEGNTTKVSSKLISFICVTSIIMGSGYILHFVLAPIRNVKPYIPLS